MKLLFDFRETDGTPVGGESMWVAITGIGEDEYEGELRNASLYADMGFGEVIDFEARHVIGVCEG